MQWGFSNVVIRPILSLQGLVASAADFHLCTFVILLYMTHLRLYYHIHGNKVG